MNKIESPNSFKKYEKLPHEGIPASNGIESVPVYTQHKNGVLIAEKSIDFDGHRDASEHYDVLTFTPKTDTYRDAVYFAGFTSRAGHYKESMALFSEKTDTKVTTLNRLEGLDIGPVRYGNEDRVPGTQLAKVLAIQEILDHEQLEDADIFAHSEGSIHAITSAFLFPDRFKNILLVNPAGIIPMSAGELAFQGAQESKVRSIEQRADENKSGKDKARELLDNALMLYQSVRNISKVSQEGLMLEMIKEIRERGVKVGLLYTDRDKLFPQQELEEHVTKNGEFLMTDMFDHVQLERGDHSDMLREEHVEDVLARAFNELRNIE